MNEKCVNCYKTCRENAGLTQEEAAQRLFVSIRQLQNYEASTRVPDEMVEQMVKVYNTPLLAWWHIKNVSPLGKYLPEVVLPSTAGDMAFQTILAQDEINLTVDCIKKIMLDGKIDYEEIPDLKNCIRVMNITSGKLLSAAAFGEDFIKRHDFKENEQNKRPFQGGNLERAI
jgi:transcriptional regulator with XRE-family HTH domain